MSFAVIKTFTTLFTGTTISLSTLKSLGWPGFKSFSSIEKVGIISLG